MVAQIKILGCGPSMGVPNLRGFWGKCDPNEPKNRRLRTSIILETPQATILFDTGPDLRQQCLNMGITHIDAVVYTHAHADHIYGLHEIRLFTGKKIPRIPLYTPLDMVRTLQNAFSYALDSQDPYYYPFAKIEEIQGDFTIQELKLQPLKQYHGHQTSWGYRVGSFAYSTDFHALPEETLEALRGVQTWVVDCLQMTSHQTHSWFEQTLHYIRMLEIPRAILIHMGAEMDYQTLKALCPTGVEPAYDGMVIPVVL